MSAFRSGDFVAAAGHFERLVKSGGRKNPELLYMLGTTLVHSGNLAGGRRHLLRAIDLEPKRSHYHAQLAVAHLQSGELDEAIRRVDRALRLQDDHPAALTTKADLLWLMGEFAEARELLEPHAAAEKAYPGIVVRFARLVGREDPARGVAILERLLETTGLAPFHRTAALYRLGELLDRAGRYDQAFAAFAEANEASGGAARFDAAAHRVAVERLVASWSAESLERLPRAGDRSGRPLLIVGMMRSGTTLVEQILASHPAVAAGGELPTLGSLAARLLGGMGYDALAGVRAAELDRQAVEGGAREYLAALGKVSGHAKRVTDKSPHNFYLLGLADLLIPGARVIHCTRDPLDTCISCYFQELGPHQHPAAGDLGALGVYHRHYRRVMEHWQKVLRIPVLEFSYEALVEDQGGRTRQLLEFAELPFDEACLRPHEAKRSALTLGSDQVRREIYATSVGRWRNYERHLGPLRAALTANR